VGSAVKHLVGTGFVKSLAISPDGRHIAAAFEPWGAALWDLDGNRLAIGDRVDRVNDLAFSPDGKYLATAESGAAHVWRSDTGAKVAELSGQDLRAVSFSRDCASLAAAGGAGVTVWDWKSGREAAHSPFQIGLGAAILSPGGYYMAQSNGFRVDVYEVATRHQLARTPQEQNTSILAFSASGNLLATATWSETAARVWQTRGAAPVAKLQQDDEVEGLAFSPNERYLATASSNTTIAWDLTQQRPVARVKQAGRVGAVGFSSDGKYLVSGSSDGTIAFSIWRPDDLVQEACRHLFGNLNGDQWKQFFGGEPYRKTCQNLP